MTSLFDVNVLLALLDVNHVHHRTAKNWLLRQEDRAWASCPITQNGFLRIIAQPSYPRKVSMGAAKELLAEACASPHHHFWHDDISLLDGSRFDHQRLHGPGQLTDAYLLALAVKMGGQLVALDRSISTSSVLGVRSDSLFLL